jgi:hypothetical protein
LQNADTSIIRALPMTIRKTRGHGLRRFSSFLRMRNDEAHLLNSPRNAERLLRALEGARARTGTQVTIEAIRAQYGLEVSK